jgi:hypothetical protein
VRGEAGNDTICEAVADFLNGGTGNDVLIGGANAIRPTSTAADGRPLQPTPQRRPALNEASRIRREAEWGRGTAPENQPELLMRPGGLDRATSAATHSLPENGRSAFGCGRSLDLSFNHVVAGSRPAGLNNCSSSLAGWHSAGRVW